MAESTSMELLTPSILVILDVDRMAMTGKRGTRQTQGLNGSPPKQGRQRVLYFIRHGQYSQGAGGGLLTELGLRQASLLRAYFRALPIHSVSSSDLPRAVQTAEVLALALGISRVKRYTILREVMPVAVRGVRVPLESRERGKRQIDEIASGWFKRTGRTRHEIIVCHGNLIRCLACRVLRAPLTSFSTMDVHHASITCFTVDDQAVHLTSFNETQHVPERLRSSK